MRKFKQVAMAVVFLMSASTTSAQPETAFYEHSLSDDCTLTLTKTNQSDSVRARFKNSGSHQNKCNLTRHQTLQAFITLFERLSTKEPEIKSLGIGRLVDWGWLGRSIHQYAETSPLWPKNRKIYVSAAFSNKFVENALQEVLLEPLLSSNNAGMLQRFHSFSCEKILLDKGRLPYDGLCWITFK